MNKFVVMYLISVLILFFGCVPKHDRILTIINNSNKTLEWAIGLSYPDTSMNLNKTKWIVSTSNPYINQNSKNSIIEENDKEAWFKNSFAKDTMMLFLYDKQVVSTIPDIGVRNNYMILKRYDLSLGDLNRLNWTITYP